MIVQDALALLKSLFPLHDVHHKQSDWIQLFDDLGVEAMMSIIAGMTKSHEKTSELLLGDEDLTEIRTNIEISRIPSNTRIGDHRAFKEEPNISASHRH